jgi:hypothetical protein
MVLRAPSFYCFARAIILWFDAQTHHFMVLRAPSFYGLTRKPSFYGLTRKPS